ncbi:MAG: PhzF family phenazine biosynthesis protein [Pseudorhodoplanes sp.]
MRRQFYTLDVFTDRRFAGNPLAVVTEAAHLDTPAMQAIAREFNHPETVFVLPPDDPKHRAKLRIFTPAAELPFAGHPTVGAAVLLARLDGGGVRDFAVEEKIGRVPCHAKVQTADAGHARFAVPSLPARAGDGPQAADIAAALSLQPADIGFGRQGTERWSAGVPFTFIPLKNLETMARVRPDPAHFERVLGIGGPGKAYLFCAECAQGGNDFHARMFAPGMGIPEAPATGSAAAAFAGLIAASGERKDGEHLIRIEQGVEMGRPSLIELGLTLRGGTLAAATIGGGAVIVTEGQIEA